MPQPPVSVDIADLSGGRNTAMPPDRLDPNEVRDLTNLRISERFGAAVKRNGTRRLHKTALAGSGPITGVVQWDGPSGKQLIAITGTKLYYRNENSTIDFTEVTPSGGNLFSTTIPQRFATFRAASAGAPLRVFIADGLVWKWDGTTLSRIDGVSAVPNSDLLIAYHTRMFYRDIDTPKTITWSKIGDAEVCTTGGVSDGGASLVDVLTGESIIAYEVVGSSLLVFTGDSIVRFTGYSSEDINVAQDTEGVSSELGVVGVRALCRADTFVPFLSDRGPYIAHEGAPVAIGTKVEPDFNALDLFSVDDAVVGYHRGRREIWFAVPTSGSGGKNKTVYVYSTRLQQWYGPFTFPFGIVSMARYEDPITGVENIMAGCDDGFVRVLDDGFEDDLTLYSGIAEMTGANGTDFRDYTADEGLGLGLESGDSGSMEIQSNRLRSIDNVFGGSGYSRYTNSLMHDNFDISCDIVVPDQTNGQTYVTFRGNDELPSSGSRQYMKVGIAKVSANVGDLLIRAQSGSTIIESYTFSNLSLPALASTGLRIHVSVRGAVITVYTSPYGGGALTFAGEATMTNSFNDSSHQKFGHDRFYPTGGLGTTAQWDNLKIQGQGEGTAFSTRLEYGTQTFEPGPGFRKKLDQAVLQAYLRTGDALALKISADNGTETTYTISGESTEEDDFRSLREDINEQGKRFTVVIEDSTPTTYPYILTGLSLSGYNTGRRD